MMHVRFKPSEHELNVIKSCTVSTGTGTEKPLTIPGYTIRPELQHLVDQHNICFDDWIEGDASVLVRDGYQSNMVQAHYDTARSVNLIGRFEFHSSKA
jgi:hypothetical protein